MFLRSIGIYKPIAPGNSNTLFKAKSGYECVESAGSELEKFEDLTLPKLTNEIKPINYFIYSGEHHYIKAYKDYLLVIVSKNFIEPAYLLNLVFNINQVYSNPKKVYGLKLDQILKNPLAYSKQLIKMQDVKLEALKQQLDELKLELIKVQEKLLARAEALELLVDRTNNLEQDAFKFHKDAKEGNQCACWSYVPRFG